MLIAETKYRTERIDHLGIVSGICQEIGLAETIDNQIGANGRQVSVGQAAQAMVLNGYGKDAGIRTYAAVSLGACVFGIVPFSAANVIDPTRIAAQVIPGIGFLGAGVILPDRNHVKGLTTAAVLWVSAAVGSSIAYGLFLLASTTALLSVLLLFIYAIQTGKNCCCSYY